MSLLEHAHQVIETAKAEERKSRRYARRAEPRISDPATHPRRYVSLAVAADYLEVDRKTLNIYLLDRRIAFSTFGKRRKIEVAELVAFERRQKTDARVHVMNISSAGTTTV